MGNSKIGKPQDISTNGPGTTKKTGSFQISKEPVIHAKTEEDVHKYAVTKEEPQAAKPVYEELGQLPESYDANTIFLIARDPKWLFSYWDIAWNKFPAGDTKDGEKKIFLNVFSADGHAQALIEINLEARNWYIPVDHASAAYYVEIGYFNKKGKWTNVAKSNTATTPPDAMAGESGVEFATVPMHLTFQRLVDIVKAAMAEGESLVGALSRLQGEGRKLAFSPGKTPNWTEEQRQLLIALLGTELVDRVGLGSAEIDQLLRKELLKKLNTESASEIVAKGLWGPGVSSLFSGINLLGSEVTSLFSGIGSSWSAQPFGEEKERGFFLHVNAEVIFYGGTHPDAQVTIDGKEIKLNPDGSFRYHFKFPDGDYDIPIVAVSPDKVEDRSATISFRRATTRKGDVGHTAQPKTLKKPLGGKRK